MNIRDIAIGQPPERRRIGIAFDQRHRVMAAAKKIYVELGVPCDVDEWTISLNVPRLSASFFAGMLERATGRIAFNEWETPR